MEKLTWPMLRINFPNGILKKFHPYQKKLRRRVGKLTPLWPVQRPHAPPKPDGYDQND